MGHSEHPEPPDRQARFDQEFAAVKEEWLPYMDDEDRKILEDALRNDMDFTHHVHSLLSELLLPHQAVPFLLGAARHLRADSPKPSRKTPLLAGIYALTMRPSGAT